MNEMESLQRFVRDNTMRNLLQRDRRKSMIGKEESRLKSGEKKLHLNTTKEHIGINGWMQDLDLSHINYI